MTFDGNFIHLLCEELNEILPGARVDKIHNPAKEEFVLHLRNRDGAQKLLICLSPGRARAGVVSHAPENPQQPGMFCMLLRKHLQGAALTGIRQPGSERILFFDFAGRTEIGDPARLRLCAEFTGRRTNLLLLREDNAIVDCLKRTDVTQGGRLLLPGARYELPPANGYVPPAPADPPPAGSRSALLEAHYSEKDRAERKRQQSGVLLKLVQNRSARINRKLAAQREELARAQDREHLRVRAELILANQARLEREARGAGSYRLENYYDSGAMLSVPADPALNPAANAQRYYKEYRKAKTAASLLGGLIARGEQELQYLESVTDLLLRCETPAEAEALRHELEAQGYCKAKGAGKQKKQRPLPPLEYTSGEGLRILAGRNNLQNDQLSLKTAKPGDLWFHARNMPGSHVILCTEGKPPGRKSIEEAAMLAAWHSRAGGPAEVDYTPAAALKKPPGAPPGKVTYHRHQSMFAQPTREQVDALRKR
ncbi:MAG: NFACT family protein [Oscillospiraceae bacterium]|jgi:predicted ribosome quality control (RQC) complex YloA/Tae2 family protein|nr:NFACT family protein [Oscillospiraceae bacterium]